jgi:hypothetical protein
VTSKQINIQSTSGIIIGGKLNIFIFLCLIPLAIAIRVENELTVDILIELSSVLCPF